MEKQDIHKYTTGYLLPMITPNGNGVLIINTYKIETIRVFLANNTFNLKQRRNQSKPRTSMDDNWDILLFKEVKLFKDIMSSSKIRYKEYIIPIKLSIPFEHFIFHDEFYISSFANFEIEIYAIEMAKSFNLSGIQENKISQIIRLNIYNYLKDLYLENILASKNDKKLPLLDTTKGPWLEYYE
ncbi:hypothetical protein TCON_1401 [Astathelohania contejeani]|uniref:Uncharacterized protein n=1 Tax=Astathelohania contejeani TaxID=164912 RepID=A0ABQ7HZ05_9MICR|nr:hypothetical protein TCON_1401 [Thelohania contejeani]